MSSELTLPLSSPGVLKPDLDNSFPQTDLGRDLFKHLPTGVALDLILLVQEVKLQKIGVLTVLPN